MDVIDSMLTERGIRFRSARPDARTNAQAAYEALLGPESGSERFPLRERLLVALFVAQLHQSPSAVSHYQAAFLAEQGSEEIASMVVTAADEASVDGPYGTFETPSLASESVEGPAYRIDQIVLAYALGDLVCAALEFAHLIVLHPRDASREDLIALRGAGWDPDSIVTLGQLLGFLTFQLRVVAGLQAIERHLEARPEHG